MVKQGIRGPARLGVRVRRRTSVVATTALAVLALLATAVSAAPAERPSSTWVPNGFVWDIGQVGDLTLVGGRFTSLRNVATGEVVAKARLAAFDSDGELVRDWGPTIEDGAVETIAVSDDGATVIIGGWFMHIDGSWRPRVAALDATDGALQRQWRARPDSTVHGLHIDGDTVYLGGRFLEVDGTRRPRLAAVRLSNGDLVEEWQPRANNIVYSLAPHPDGSNLAVGGRFSRLNGSSSGRYVGAVSLSTGDLAPSQPDRSCDCTAFEITSDDQRVYAAVAGPGGRLEAYETDNTRSWTVYTDGDVQAVDVRDGAVYVGGHFVSQFGGEPRTLAAAVAADTGEVLPWAPDMDGGYPGVWAVLATERGVHTGGDFDDAGNAGLPRYAFFPEEGEPPPPPPPPPADDGEYIAAGSTWSFWPNGSEPDAAWRDPAFDEAGWSQGAAELGFGDGGEATVVSLPSETPLYARHTFTLEALPSSTTMQVDLVRDDGAVVYVNGVEAARSNMPDGEVTHDTLASGYVNGAAESTPMRLTVPTDALREGPNVVAVSVHQAGPSSDLSFDLSLTVTP